MSNSFETIPNIADIAAIYKNVITTFKNRTDVLNGFALGYRLNQDPNGVLLEKNKPVSIGQGLTTTGFCVSVSQAFLNDKAFKALIDYRGSHAKLVSIDLKEQFYGHCYNGSKNTWHTAVLVYDSGVFIIIDLTCAQFGNQYVDKFIWDFATWEQTFRSPLCKHEITDPFGNIITYNYMSNRGSQYISGEIIPDNNSTNLRFILDKNSNINNREKAFMIDMISNKKIGNMNANLIGGNITVNTYKDVNNFNKILYKFDICKFNIPLYGIMEFPNKKSLIKYLNKLDYNKYKIDHYLLLKDYLPEYINRETVDENTTHYLVFEILPGFEVIDFPFSIDGYEEYKAMIPAGINLGISDTTKFIYNGIKKKNTDSMLRMEKTDTIYITVNNE